MRISKSSACKELAPKFLMQKKHVIDDPIRWSYLNKDQLLHYLCLHMEHSFISLYETCNELEFLGSIFYHNDKTQSWKIRLHNCSDSSFY